MKRRIRIASLLLVPQPPGRRCGACGDDDRRLRQRRHHRRGQPTGTAASGEAVKIGFITKFPVDFYDTMVDAAEGVERGPPRGRAASSPRARAAPTTRARSPPSSRWSPRACRPSRSRRPAPTCRTRCRRPSTTGIKVVLIDNDIPDWDGKTARRRHRQPGGRQCSPASSWPSSSSRATRSPCSQGVPGAPSLDDRVTGFLEGLGDGFEIVATLPTDCDQTKGLDAAQDILTANPDVDAIYGACGPPIIGAIEAIASAGMTIKVVGFDAGPDEVAAIVAGDRARVGRAVPRQDG